MVNGRDFQPFFASVGSMFSQQGVKKVRWSRRAHSLQLVDETITRVLRRASLTDDEGGHSDRRDSLDDIIEREVEGGEDSYDYDDTAEESPEESVMDEDELARAHWMQLQKTNKQGIVVQNAFIHILTKYKHMRPVWQFGRKIDDSQDDWKTRLYEDFYFRHHCASIQAGLTMVMENKDDPTGMRKLLNEIGAHHFFYDACEPHLEVFLEGMIESMKRVLHGVHAIDEDTENSWKYLLKKIKENVAEGISIQRSAYMRQCLTVQEMQTITEKWTSVEEYGLLEAGQMMCETAFVTYRDLLRRYHLDMQIPDFRNNQELFAKFAHLTILSLDETIKCHKEGIGFSELPEKVKDYVVALMMLDVCPTLVRKAFMEGTLSYFSSRDHFIGLISMLSKVLGETVSEGFMHLWSKLYRVLEQAVVLNIVDY